MNKSFYILAIILILGSSLRFYRLGSVPVGFHRDEAFLGYNAYSILKTGKDMSDKMLPLHLESFIYSPAGYSYFSIPFIVLFNLNELSVRAASAFFGSLTIFLIYLLAKELFQMKHTDSLALFASLLFAVSPWHINLSRTATENVIVVFFLLLGILFFLKYVRRGYIYLALSFVCFGITFLLYQAPRAFLPIFVPLLVLCFMQRKKLIKDEYVLGFFYLFIIVLPIIFILKSTDLSLRIRSLSIFHSNQTKIILTEQIANDGSVGLPYLATRIFHNKIVGYSLLFFENYFKHFNFDFLFLDNSFPERYRVPMIGLLYIFEFPLIFLGLFYIFQRERKAGMFLIGWILITPIGSALTFDDVPNLQRTLINLPAFSILSAVGLVSLLEFLKLINMKVYKLFILLAIFIVAYSLSYYLVQYYTQAINYKTWYRQDGYRDLVYKVNIFLPQYKKAIITNRESAPTIFFLFYTKYSPEFFHKEISKNNHRSFDRMNFGKYVFTEDECPLGTIKDKEVIKSITEENILYVNSALCEENPLGSKTLAEIKRLDGSFVFKVLEHSKQ